MSEFVFVYITFENPLQAETIAEAVVAENLAACVNIFPAMRSIYKWQGQMQASEETVGIAKTRKSLFRDLEKRVVEMHSYATPCIVSMDITDGSDDFLEWMHSQTK